MAWYVKIGVQENNIGDDNKRNNAREFFNYFFDKGLTVESICGMLGNVQRESQLNSGNKQTASDSSGWGLIQWTPARVLTAWCRKYNYAWYDGSAQCERIWAEGTGTRGASGYFIPTSSYPYSWNEFCQLTDVEEATKAYLYERERAGDEALDLRISYANWWYSYFTGEEPPEPQPPTPPKRKINPVLIKRKKGVIPPWL